MDKKKVLATTTGAAAGLVTSRLVDFALMGALMCAAVGAVALAGYETMVNDHSPKVNGLKYLAIFAQPSHRDASGDAAPFALDMNPVGAVARAAPVDASGYSMVGAQTHFAWLREGNRIFSASPGDDLPRVGRIAAIEARDGRWTLIGPKGEALLIGGAVEIGDPAGGHFDKRMIFSGAR